MGSAVDIDVRFRVSSLVRIERLRMEENAAASALSPLSESEMIAVRQLCNQAIRPLVHQRW